MVAEKRRWLNRLVGAGMMCVCYVSSVGQTLAPAWRGVVEDEQARRLGAAQVRLVAGEEHPVAVTAVGGDFRFPTLVPNTYKLSIEAGGRVYRTATEVKIPAVTAAVVLMLKSDGTVDLSVAEEKVGTGGGGAVKQQSGK